MLFIRAFNVSIVASMAIFFSACSQQTIHDDDDTDTPSKKQASISKKTQQTKQTTALVMPKTSAGIPRLSQAELNLIAYKIFQNEGGGNYNNLVHWNDREDFASLGIGHFTWYPPGRPARFGNTFPELLDYLRNNGVQLPPTLQQARYQGAPWYSKASLMQAKQSGQVQELQNLLYQTRLLQAQFIVDRARRALPKLVNAAPSVSRSKIAQNLNAVANTPGGWYALVDYVNFKGEGLNYYGGYKGQNWGLLQVLENMQPSQPGRQALHEFANAAMRVLERRVRNSPPGKNEQMWLAGWGNRVNTYRNPGV